MKNKISISVMALLLAFSLAAPLAMAKGVQQTEKIIGGQEADPNSWPWMTALVVRGRDAYQGQFCGGSLVADKWVLTAAHCIVDIDADELDVVINQADLSVDTGERIGVAAIFQHENYNPNTMDSDIALLLLTTPSNQTPIEMMPQGDPDRLARPFTNATVLGWGDTSPGYGDYPENLMEVNVPILPPVLGFKIYQSAFTRTMMVAGPKDGGEDTCYGDSGGPLLLPNYDGTGYVLTGLTSWGYGCAQAGSPGVYTRVSVFEQWISQKMSESTPQ